MLGWGDQEIPCPQMLEHVQGRQGVCQGRGSPREWSQQALATWRQTARSLRPDLYEAKDVLFAPRVPQNRCSHPPGLVANCFCQKALGWLLLSPTVLPPSIVSMLSSTYSEGMKSSLYLSLSSPPSLPAHLTAAVSPSGASTTSLLSSPLPSTDRCRTSSQTGGKGFSKARAWLRMGCLQPAGSFQDKQGQERKALS